MSTLSERRDDPWWAGRWRIALDAAAWVVGLVVAATARYDFTTSGMNTRGVALTAVFVALLHVVIGGLVVYRGQYRYGTFDEVSALAGLVFVVAAVTLAVVASLPFERRLAPLSAPLFGGVLALLLMVGLRWLGRRAARRRVVGRRDREPARRALVLGAGEGARRVVRDMVHDPSSPYVPVGLLDDDPKKRHLRLDGIKVQGAFADVVPVAARTKAEVLVVAAPTVDAAAVRDATREAAEAGLTVKIAPTTAELLSQGLRLQDLRDLTVGDLLGRHHINTDAASIAEYLQGRRVLVTGAGGSIGSELCRQVLGFRPAELVAMDRDESALHALRLAVADLPGSAALTLVLADLRDERRIDHMIATARPDVVLHAAALKHVTTLESHPGEAVQTNVWGTINLLQACADHGVPRFVCVSTDKAADPVSVLGWSKRICERLTAWYALQGGRDWVSVRFGNVLASRGSVLHTFSQQIEAGGPLTLTDTAATRYFMTAAEAIELLVQAGALGEPGEALVLDMGEPIQIGELADRLMELQGRRVPVEVIGLHPAEKLHEARLGEGEVDHRPQHPLISHVPVPPLAPAEVRGLDPWADPDKVADDLRRAAESHAEAPSGRM